MRASTQGSTTSRIFGNLSRCCRKETPEKNARFQLRSAYCTGYKERELRGLSVAQDAVHVEGYARYKPHWRQSFKFEILEDGIRKAPIGSRNVACLSHLCFLPPFSPPHSPTSRCCVYLSVCLPVSRSLYIHTCLPFLVFPVFGFDHLVLPFSLSYPRLTSVPLLFHSSAPLLLASTSDPPTTITSLTITPLS